MGYIFDVLTAAVGEQNMLYVSSTDENNKVIVELLK